MMERVRRRPITSVWATASSQMTRSLLLLLFGFLFSLSPEAKAQKRVYQKPSDFLKEAVGGLSGARVIQLNSRQKKVVRSILGHHYKTSAIRCWQGKGRTAFILEEIGKAEYITTGFVLQGGKIVSTRVLVYRESHGWEVARPAFTRQFRGAQMRSDTQLDRGIRNIAGATLSVRALTRLGRLALYLETQI